MERNYQIQDEHLHKSNDTQDWYNPSPDNYYYGDESRLLETEELGHSSYCSSPGNSSYDGDEYSYNFEITDESELDGEVGWLLGVENAYT
ncbi:hypothetical protein L2E82_01750 [Cichorium intybus]|uniref:Uncharacterized protein n=1 Tax=Cichorium intybus TaxID=13427 RepID=A0ACB9H1X1_CICIN|nr:hypothetical protein L2E82_01750 [Cichorium intybus]